MCVGVNVWDGDPVLFLFSTWLIKGPRRVSNLQCYHCHISNLLYIKHVVPYEDSTLYYWWELCLSHKLFVYKVKHIILWRCALFSEKKKFRLILWGKKKTINLISCLFSSAACVGYKDLVFPVSELHDETLDLRWRRKDIQVSNIYSSREKWIDKPSHTKGQCQKRRSFFMVPLIRNRGCNCWTHHVDHTLMLDYITGKNLYKYLDTVMTNYPFFFFCY